MPAPEVRAAFLKSALESFGALSPPAAAGARARLPPATAAAIGAADRLDWLPARHALELLAAVHAVAGDEGVRFYAVASMEVALHAPLMRGFLDAALAVPSPSPLELLRAFAAAFPLHYQDAGELVVSAGPGDRTARVLHVGIPELLLAPNWLLAVAACMGRVAALASPDGVRAEPVRDGPRVAYVVRW